MPDYSTYLRRFQAGEKSLNPYLDYFDITIEEVREGYARFRMPVLPPAFGITTVELKCNFLAPVKKGELIAEASIFKKGRTLIIGDCLVKDENDRDVLRCTATFLMFSGSKDPE